MTTPGLLFAVISYALWTQRFHQSLAVLGETLTLNDKPFKVVGILPSGFSYRVLDSPHDVDVVRRCGSGFQPYGLADHKGDGLGVGFADCLCRGGAPLGLVQHLMGLCCRQHKPIYVAQRFMWRSPLDGPEEAPARADERHIT